MSRKFAAFFDPLVGSPEAAERFRGLLARRINEGTRPDDAAARFGKLSQALGTIVDLYDRRLLAAGTEPDKVDHIIRNVRIGAVTLTVNALRSVCQHYTETRDGPGGLAPQRRSSVALSTGNTLEFLLTVASRSTEQAQVGIHAAQHGIAAQDLSTSPELRRSFTRGSASPAVSLYPAFEVRHADDDQIEVALRHPLPRYTGDRKCPAIDEATPAGDESLYEYLKVVGGVVVDEILGHQISIVDD